MTKSRYVSVDIGGTHIRVANSSDGRDFDSTRKFDQEDYSSPSDWLADVLDGKADLRSARWALGIASPVENNRTVADSANLPSSWHGRALPRALEDEGIDFVLENDANLAALGESRFGAGQDVPSLLLITLGTGIGGGIVIDNRLYSGASGAAAEVGHMVLEPGGRPCGCGNTGCFERYGSATGLEETYRRLSGRDRDAYDIIKYVDSDPLAREASVQTGLYIGRGVAQLLNVLEPDRVLFSGGLAGSLEVLMPWIRQGMRPNVFTRRVREVPLKRAQLEEPGLWGGMALAEERVKG